MSVVTLLDLTVKEEAVDAARELFTRVAAETCAFDGCLGIEVLVQDDDPTRWTFIERWTSMDHDRAYREFRSGAGQITELPPLLAGTPGRPWFAAAPS